MKKFIKSLMSQWVINYFYHLPMAILANILYGFPSRNLKVIGVTGTDGKTTTVNMIYQILKDAGKKVSMVSTINAEIGGKSYDTGFHVTSPDPFMVQRLTKESVDGGSGYMILEVTSHGLDQFRFWGIKFDMGVITNITHEHLDYHKTFENYKKAKLKLIRNVKFAVVNENLKTPSITFGLKSGVFNQKKLKLKLQIPGDYNIENALAAFAVSDILGIDQKKARQTLENFRGLTGRMEEIPNEKGIKIIIDFAHTPNGLENALRALRFQAKRGRLIAVFGSAGKRDVEKRTLMGQVAGRLADIAVVTAEDPRGELDLINMQIIKGAKKAGASLNENFFIINDRKKAIDFAINNLAKKGDIVGIFGKGHEKSMNLDGKTEIPWLDKKVVMEALNG